MANLASIIYTNILLSEIYTTIKSFHIILFISNENASSVFGECRNSFQTILRLSQTSRQFREIPDNPDCSDNRISVNCIHTIQTVIASFDLPDRKIMI